jgi:hypothetical protein
MIMKRNIEATTARDVDLERGEDPEYGCMNQPWTCRRANGEYQPDRFGRR